MPCIYVILLAWNQYHHTKACLASLGETAYSNLQIVVVDNDSTDGTAEQVRQDFPLVTVLVNDENIGFAAGNNVGIRHALAKGADYVFVLNNDTLVAADLFDQLLATAEPIMGASTKGRTEAGAQAVSDGSTVGLIAPMIYYADEPQRIWSSGGQRHFLTYEKRGDLHGQLDIGKLRQPEPKDYFTGCAMLISRELLTTVGLFDERFFFTYEDSDLCFRARENGFALMLAPNAHIWHKVSVSTGGSGSPAERYWMARCSILFFAKHVRSWRWLIVAPYRTASAIRTSLRLFGQGRPDSLRSYWRGLRDGLAQVWHSCQ